MYAKMPLRVAAAYAGGAAGVATTRVLLAAPGAGLRYRIAFASLALEYTATGTMRVNIAGASVGTPILWLAVSAAANRAYSAPIPGPGFVMPTNEALNLRDIGSAGADEFCVTVLYFIDSV